MIKECRVLLRNKVATVVKYDNIEIQFPPISESSKSVFVKYENGTYSIANDIEVNDASDKYNKKQMRKKTTNKESEKDKYGIE